LNNSQFPEKNSLITTVREKLSSKVQIDWHLKYLFSAATVLGASQSLTKTQMPEETSVATEGSELKPGGWGGVTKPGARKEGGLLLSKRGKDPIHFEVTRETDEESASKSIPDEGQDYSIEDKILFYKERECLLLLLEARKVLASMITKKEAADEKLRRERREREEAEKKRTGRLTVQEIQELLQNCPDQEDFDMVTGRVVFLSSTTLSEWFTNIFYFQHRNPRTQETTRYFYASKSQARTRFGKTR
jgi:hypothetical protein